MPFELLFSGVFYLVLGGLGAAGVLVSIALWISRGRLTLAQVRTVLRGEFPVPWAPNTVYDAERSLRLSALSVTHNDQVVLSRYVWDGHPILTLYRSLSDLRIALDTHIRWGGRLGPVPVRPEDLALPRPQGRVKVIVTVVCPGGWRIDFALPLDWNPPASDGQLMVALGRAIDTILRGRFQDGEVVEQVPGARVHVSGFDAWARRPPSERRTLNVAASTFAFGRRDERQFVLTEGTPGVWSITDAPTA